MRMIRKVVSKLNRLFHLDFISHCFHLIFRDEQTNHKSGFLAFRNLLKQNIRSVFKFSIRPVMKKTFLPTWLF